MALKTPISLRLWHAEIVRHIRIGFASRAQRLTQCGGEEPWADMIGDVPTSFEGRAVFIVPRSMTLLAGPRSMGTGRPQDRGQDLMDVSWGMYHILRSTTANLSVELFEMANISRAIVHERDSTARTLTGNLWGLEASLNPPDPDFRASRIEFGLAGHACVMAEFTQQGALVDSLIEL